MSFEEVLSDRNPWWRDPKARAPTPLSRRDLQSAVRDRLLSNDRRAVVVIGPRQVGKSVLLLQCVNDLLERGWPPANLTYFDFSDDRLSRPPPSAREIAGVRPLGIREDHPRALLLDEVGKAPRWAEWLKQAVDAGGARIAATDSAATTLRKGSRESGLGRWDELHMEGLTFREYLALQAIPGETAESVLTRLPNPVQRYLAWGGFPEHVRNPSLAEVRERIRNDAIDRAILRDLVDTGVDVQRVRDLFIYLVEDSGAIFDSAARSRLLQRPGLKAADPRSVEKWLELLEDTLLIARVDPFTRAATAKLAGRSRPKFYAQDHALVVAFSSSAEPLGDPLVQGHVVETAVFRHLRQLRPRRVTYFRAGKSGAREVDFVIEGPRRRVAIEVTHSQDARDKIEDLRESMVDVKADAAVVIHGGVASGEKHGVRVLPMERFLLDPEVVWRDREA